MENGIIINVKNLIVVKDIFFDNYQNKCLKDPCFVNIKLLIILGVSGGIILLVSIIVVIVYCRKKKKKIEDINNNTSEINLVMHEENKNI